MSLTSPAPYDVVTKGEVHGFSYSVSYEVSNPFLTGAERERTNQASRHSWVKSVSENSWGPRTPVNGQAFVSRRLTIRTVVPEWQLC